MKREIDYLCACLWWAIERGPRPLSPALDWTRWLALADEHKLGGFLHRRLRGRGAWPDTVEAALAAQYVTSGFLNGLRMREQMRILSSLVPAARCMALKGFALACTRYTEAAERDMADLDLFCARREDAEAALEILRANRYAPTRQIPGHHHLPPMLHASGRLSVEVHTNLTTPGLPDAFLERFFATRVAARMPTGAEVPIADRAHMLFHHCLHTLKDPIESPLLRNLFEIAWIASEFGADEWARFFEIAESSGRSELVRRALAFARDYFAFEMPRFKRPGFSSIEFWARRRLGWISDAMHPAARRLRHVGVKHFDRMPSGRWATDGVDMARVVAASLRNAVANRTRSFFAPYRSVPLKRRIELSASMGDSTALMKIETGQVFVLRGPAASAWRAAESPISGPALRRRLMEQGTSPREARSALRALLAQNLLGMAEEITTDGRSAPDV